MPVRHRLETLFASKRVELVFTNVLALYGNKSTMKRTLNNLLTTVDVDPHVFSVCRIQAGWRMTFPVFKVVTIHFVLRGSGHYRIGTLPPAPFSAPSVLIVPAGESHWVGEAGSQAQVREAADRCALLGDGLVEFTTGSGAADTLMLCGALPVPYHGALDLPDLLQAPLEADMMARCIPPRVFEAMTEELAGAGLGTRAMCQALMKQGLIALLRARWTANDHGQLLAGVLHHPRLARVIAAIIENPAAGHTVDSLASRAGMSRASFADHFSRAFGQGPIDFVQKARLRIAARLLRVTDLPIKVIAQSVGYAGPRPFSRAFLAGYGQGPSEYRSLAESEALKLSAVNGGREVSDRPD
jgi:AraC family transcriptional activator of mtrCDE